MGKTVIPRGSTAAIVGAGGGIGGALAAACREGGFARVATFARRPAGGDVAIELEDEGSIAAAAASLTDPAAAASLTDPAAAASLTDPAAAASLTGAAAGVGGGAPLRLVVVATGLLHAPWLRPEKTYRALEPDALATLFRVNTIGPALVAKHFLPHLATEGRAVFAVLSARVGSISDNQLGGWHGYRASKAALNMIVRNLAIEVARTRPEQICVSLHPGTVATGLSAPFARSRTFSPAQSATRLLGVLDGLTPAESGRCYAHDGSEIPA